MKVKDLVARLQELSPEATVVLASLEDSIVDTEYRPVVMAEPCFYDFDEVDGGMVFGEDETPEDACSAVLLHSDPEILEAYGEELVYVIDSLSVMIPEKEKENE